MHVLWPMLREAGSSWSLQAWQEQLRTAGGLGRVRSLPSLPSTQSLRVLEAWLNGIQEGFGEFAGHLAGQRKPYRPSRTGNIKPRLRFELYTC